MRQIIKFSHYIFLAALFIASGCTAENADFSKLSCATFARTFFEKPISVQMSEFSNYDVESQYAIYICGSQTREPPSIHLAIPFAKEGKTVTELLKEKLSATQSDLTIRDILFVFEEMSRQKTYNVAADNDLMKAINVAVMRVKDPFWKKSCEQSLEEIRKQLSIRQ